MDFYKVDNKNMFVAHRGNISVLKSYNKIIAIVLNGEIYLNSEYYNYSTTTSRHRNLFLGVSAKEFEQNCKKSLYNFISDNEMQELYYGIE